MDASAYLVKQGWLGTGHSLDTSGRGIKRPLLISHKQDQLGLGKRKAAHTADDQWWMRAFDESLKNIGTGKESTLSQVREKGINRGGLYGFFVKGEGLAGTVENSESEGSGKESDRSTNKGGVGGEITPPTSASESDIVAKSTDDGPTMAKSKKGNKRKRESEDDGTNNDTKKQKQDVSTTLTKQTVLGTLSSDQIAKINSIVRLVQKQVSHTIKANEKKSLYGPYLAPGSERQKGKVFDDPLNPGKKIAYKSAKIQRQSNMRRAKEGVMKEKIVGLLLKGDIPNPERWTKDEALANWKKISRALEDIEKAEKSIRKQSKEEKKNAKREAAAQQRRLAKEKKEADQQLALELERAAQQSAIAAKLAKKSPEDRAKYEARAAAKGQTLDEYILRRLAKKDAKHAEKTAKQEAELAPEALFFVDTTGDPTLPPPPPPAYTPLPDGTCPLDPMIWEGRIVKTLPKPVREARRKYLEQLRNERKLRAGKAIDTGPSRSEVKIAELQRVTREVLKEQGIKKRATKEQQTNAKREARKRIRVEKREDLIAKGKGKMKWGGGKGSSGRERLKDFSTVE
ncbi:hypothetical protein CC80DRAFT_493111 [Byssothecium circinans]|uniref:G-patch domain-containing protein n=1 Tax=Byssothecium circinans TaxID=147558 RepID=A0A6A5TRY2_9PLEO|nr:hypothetical protein CC80DRAFT_493111 [Byssothecium circinans]